MMMRSAVRVPLLAAALAACGMDADNEAASPSPAADAPAAPVRTALAEAATTPAGGCLPYGPDTVTVTGTLERRTFYGPPGFGEDPANDEPEPGFYVVPDAPLCTRAGSDPFDEPLRDVRLVQMVIVSGYAQHRPHLGRRVRATGTLFGAHTGHHHAPLLLQVHTIQPADAPH